jgi:Flp pilus assembly protein TadD
MKTNWGPAGLRQAENYLQSALQVGTDSTNAKVLLGYVYAHQGRYKPAEALFLEASKTETKNQWLWVNWGELLEMQGKSEAAAQKYREALSPPRTHDTYDRARQEAYSRLITLLSKRKDLDGVERAYRQQLADFGAGNCFVAQYARFMLQERGDTAKAIQLARELLELRCTDVFTREVLGMAYYTQWASSNGQDKVQSINQARIYFPVGPKLLFWLATADRTAVAAKALVASGEPIDQKDNAGATALAYALQFKDHGAGRRLLSLGARGDAPIGADAIPLGVLVVIGGDIDGIRLLQRHGVDVAKLRYRGKSALDYARQTGDSKLVGVLESKGHST